MAPSHNVRVGGHGSVPAAAADLSLGSRDGFLANQHACPPMDGSGRSQIGGFPVRTHLRVGHHRPLEMCGGNPYHPTRLLHPETTGAAVPVAQPPQGEYPPHTDASPDQADEASS